MASRTMARKTSANSANSAKKAAPRLPASVSNRLTGVADSVRKSAGGKAVSTVGKLRQIDPGVAKKSAASGGAGAKDVFRMAVAYTKQETIDPLKTIGRYVAFGLAGAVFLGFGLVLFVLAGLRALQTQTETTFTGNLSWIPYLMAVAIAAVLIGLIVFAMTRAIKQIGDRS